MITWYEIPLSPQAQSLFISINNVTYYMTFKYRDCTEGGWFLDIADQSQNPLVQGIPLVTGADLLQPYSENQFGFPLIVATDGSPDTPPTYSNLGISSHVYYGIL